MRLTLFNCASGGCTFQSEQQFRELLFQLHKILMIEWLHDPDHQVEGCYLHLLFPEKFAQDTTHIITVYRPFCHFFGDHHTQSGAAKLIGLVMNGKKLARNPFAETKNG